MAKAILIDEFHLTFRAPSGLPDAAYGAMRRVLDDRRRVLDRALQPVAEFEGFDVIQTIEAASN